MQKFVPRSRVGFFRNEHTRSTPLTLNSRFHVFLTIWVHYGPFCCVMKLGAKRAELVQKFVPRSGVGILTTTLPDPPHWTLNLRFAEFATIWVHSGPFGCLMKLGAKRAELVQMFVPRSRVGFFRNERTRSTPFPPKLMFWCISYHLGASRTIWLSHETRW